MNQSSFRRKRELKWSVRIGSIRRVGVRNRNGWLLPCFRFASTESAKDSHPSFLALPTTIVTQIRVPTCLQLRAQGITDFSVGRVISQVPPLLLILPKIVQDLLCIWYMDELPLSPANHAPSPPSAVSVVLHDRFAIFLENSVLYPTAQVLTVA